MSGYKAEFAENEARLSGDFGESLAIRYFGKEQVDQLRKLSKGKNKGRYSGIVRWKKCTRGGWVTGRGVTRAVGRIVEISLIDEHDRGIAGYNYNGEAVPTYAQKESTRAAPALSNDRDEIRELN